MRNRQLFLAFSLRYPSKVRATQEQQEQQLRLALREALTQTKEPVTVH